MLDHQCASRARLSACIGAIMLSAVIGLPVATLAQTQTATEAQKPDAKRVDDIAAALRGSVTRGGKGVTVDPATRKVIGDFKALRRTRGPTLLERRALHSALKPLPQIDLQISFKFNSAELDPAAIPQLNQLGEAISKVGYKGRTFIIAGHTDRKGKPSYNLDLSTRRADAVRQYLVKTFQLDDDALNTVGYGFEHLANPQNPFADENRRVQIVNAGT
jgi:outer membrane protein OmpA-like peptidoglycan-associated protein